MVNKWLVLLLSFMFLLSFIHEINVKGLDGYKIETIVGGDDVFGDGLAATEGNLYSPNGLAQNANGDVFIVDTQNHRIRKVSNGIISTIAGNGIAGFSGDGSVATNAKLNTPYGVAVHPSTNEVYFTDTQNHRIRKVSSSGTISTVVGTGTSGFSGDGGQATSAQISSPYGIDFHPNGDLYFAGNGRIRKVSNGIISTIAGAGSSGTIGDGNALTTRLIGLAGLRVQSNGDIYFSHTNTEPLGIRKVSNGNVTTLITSKKIMGPDGLAISSNGDIYVCDNYAKQVVKISNVDGTVSIIAGTGAGDFGGDGGLASSAMLIPGSVIINSNGDLLVSDLSSMRIRKISSLSGIISTVIGGSVGDGRLSSNARLFNPVSISMNPIDNGYLIADPLGKRIRKVSNTGYMSTIIGTGIAVSTYTAGGDGTIAVNTMINNPAYVTTSSTGEVYFSEFGRIRKISPNGYVTTVVGDGTTPGFSGDGGSALSAKLGYSIMGIALSSNNDLYFSDSTNHVVRKVSNGIVSRVAGKSPCGFTDGVAATTALLCLPSSIAIYPNGDVLIADSMNNYIRKVSASTGIITRIAGTAAGYSGDGGYATNAALNRPQDLILTSSGEIIFCDYSNSVIRKIDTRGIITTIAGTGSSGFSGDGGLASNATLSQPNAIAMNSNGEILFSDNGNKRIRKLIPLSNNVTLCSSGYYGNNCEFYNCFGVEHSNGLVCSGRGQCTQVDTCKCNSGYEGTKCETIKQVVASSSVKSPIANKSQNRVSSTNTKATVSNANSLYGSSRFLLILAVNLIIGIVIAKIIQ